MPEGQPFDFYLVEIPTMPAGFEHLRGAAIGSAIYRSPNRPSNLTVRVLGIYRDDRSRRAVKTASTKTISIPPNSVLRLMKDTDREGLAVVRLSVVPGQSGRDLWESL
jgi:hypothetical protein